MTQWKWDVDPNDLTAKQGIPVTAMCPEWGYFAAFHKESPQRPTQAETVMLSSFIAERKLEWDWLIQSQGLEVDPFPWYPGYNTVIFHKYATGDWAYRRRTWPIDHLAPSRMQRGRGPLPLLALMDKVRVSPLGNPDERWVEWKQAHPEVFGDG